MDVYHALTSGIPFEATPQGAIERPDITDPNRGHPDAVAVVRTSGAQALPNKPC